MRIKNKIIKRICMKTLINVNLIVTLAIFGIIAGLTACKGERNNRETIAAIENIEMGSITKENNETQNIFNRIIEITSPRMNGDDVLHLQNRLLEMGFSSVGSADGIYGPLTAGVVNNIQVFSGFEADGKVTMSLWNFIFNNENNAFLRNVSVVSSFKKEQLIKTRNFYDHIEHIEYKGDGDPGETPSGWVYYSQTNRRSPEILVVDLGFYVFTFYFIDNTNYFVINKMNEQQILTFWINNNHRFMVENGITIDSNHNMNRIIESAFSYKDEIINKFNNEYS